MDVTAHYKKIGNGFCIPMQRAAGRCIRIFQLLLEMTRYCMSVPFLAVSELLTADSFR